MFARDAEAVAGCDGEQCDTLESIMAMRHLSPVFQPVVDLLVGTILGYEGSIRGPSDSGLHSPGKLFELARCCGRSRALDQLCGSVTLERFAENQLPQRLFLKFDPASLLEPGSVSREILSLVQRLGLEPARIILELSESQPFPQFAAWREAIDAYRQQGFRVALPGMGQGGANLRLWSELRPDFVKLDKHFVQQIHRDPVKTQFVRSMVDMARQSGAALIAEGIESLAELSLLRKLGVHYGQGNLIARSSSSPVLDVRAVMNGVVWHGARSRSHLRQQPLARDLLVEVAPLSISDNNELAYQVFAEDADCFAIPVLDHGRPVGLLFRQRFLESFAKPFNRELYGKKSCAVMMEKHPLIVAAETGIYELSNLLVSSGKRYLSDGFILTEEGAYLGMGTGYDLMRTITELQINAARYANPLTGLPGNVPINETIDRLIEASQSFVVAYADLDFFKPFNDLYGYAAGDELIELVATLLVEEADGEADFVGHVGGDDFVVLMQSTDWEARLLRVLAAFDQEVAGYFSPRDLAAQGFQVADRRGEMTLFPLTSLSIGVTRAMPGWYHSYLEIAVAAAGAKKMAKKLQGSQLFVERRHPDLRGETASADKSASRKPGAQHKSSQNVE